MKCIALRNNATTNNVHFTKMTSSHGENPQGRRQNKVNEIHIFTIILTFLLFLCCFHFIHLSFPFIHLLSILQQTFAVGQENKRTLLQLQCNLIFLFSNVILYSFFTEIKIISKHVRTTGWDDDDDDWCRCSLCLLFYQSNRQRAIQSKPASQLPAAADRIQIQVDAAEY